jgi:hypothetical protein
MNSRTDDTVMTCVTKPGVIGVAPDFCRPETKTVSIFVLMLKQGAGQKIRVRYVQPYHTKQ